MNADERRAAARELAGEHLKRGDALGWFDALYRRAAGDAEAVPWADLKPNPHLVEWVERTKMRAGRALVVGCGLGDDAEYLAGRGWSVTAFDISSEAIRWARQRFSPSHVEYGIADLFAAPPVWREAFDLVVEAYTLQALPAEVRERAAPIVASWVAPGGRLFIVARGREESDPPGELPWPLTEKEIRTFEEGEGLKCEMFEDYVDADEGGVRRFRAVFVREQEREI